MDSVKYHSLPPLFLTPAFKAFRASVPMLGVDRIHDGRKGRDLLCYTAHPDFPSAGVYLNISRDGTFTAGVYEGAHTHIGDALFYTLAQKKFSDFDAASAWCTHSTWCKVAALIANRDATRGR